MFLSAILKPPSLAGRLTVWYTIVSTALFTVAIATVYFLTATVLLNQVDEDLEEDIEEFNESFRREGMVGFWREMQQEAQADGSDQILFRLYTEDGSMLRSTDDGTWRARP